MSAEPKEFHLIRLPFPVPPGFVRMSGYGPAKRFVAFHWMEDRDELAFEDGTATGIGHWKHYALLMTSRFVQRTLFPFELGSSQQRAWHCLLADRRERIFYAGHVQDVRRFLNAAQPAHLDGRGGVSKREPVQTDLKNQDHDDRAHPLGHEDLEGPLLPESEYMAFLKRWMSDNI